MTNLLYLKALNINLNIILNVLPDHHLEYPDSCHKHHHNHHHLCPSVRHLESMDNYQVYSPDLNINANKGYTDKKDIFLSIFITREPSYQ